MTKHFDLGAVHAFILTAELRSFTRAAEVLDTTQAAISTRLRRLEEQVGKKLLERTPRSVSLSAAGAAFLEPAREMLAAQQRAIAVFEAPARRLALGISHHLVGAGLPGLLRKAAGGARSLVMDLRIGLTQELLAEYDGGGLDAVILLRHPGSRPGGERIAVDRFGWFGASDFVLAPGLPLPLATQASPCSLRAMVTERLNEAGVAWREAFVGGGAVVVGAAVEAGLAVAALSARTAPPGVVEVGKRLSLPPLPTRDVVLYSRVDDPALATNLRSMTAAFKRGR